MHVINKGTQMKKNLIVSILLLFGIIVIAMHWSNLIQLSRLFYKPKDYYKFLIKQEIDVSKNDVKKVQFLCKYPGLYSPGLILNGLEFDPKGRIKKLKLKIQIKYYVDNSLKLTTLSSEYVPFWELKTKNQGYFFNTFKCPQDLPLNKLIYCEISVVKPDKDFYNKYKPIIFYIRKMSDE